MSVDSASARGHPRQGLAHAVRVHFCPLNAPIPTPYPGHSYLLSSLL